jgi:hypothetical protein
MPRGLQTYDCPCWQQTYRQPPGFLVHTSAQEGMADWAPDLQKSLPVCTGQSQEHSSLCTTWV